jgi:2,3-bisphosphoglycerate-independent phosphoglycerate mutase
MKYAIILPDGAADEPLPVLAGKTPLQAAHIPHMDWVAQHGRLGRVLTVPEPFTPGTDVATLTLFGYDPRRYYSGRAPLEARARGLTATNDQLIFRCNFVTILDGRMKDFTAGHIAQDEANALVASLNQLSFPGETCAFHTGVSYRNLMLLAHAAQLKVTCAPPHDIPDQPVAGHLPGGDGQERVRAIMEQAAAVLPDHPVNLARKSRGQDPVTHIWLWGQGRPVAMETLRERHGLTGAAITGVDIIRGIAQGMGMELIHVPGATGYLDTDYAAKGRAAVEALRTHDVMVVHVEAPDEAGHLGDAREKVLALERMDEAIVGPVLDALRSHGDFRVLVAPDHPTPVATKAHSRVPPPFCYAGQGVAPPSGRRFTEEDAVATGDYVADGHTLFPQFLGR